VRVIVGSLVPKPREDLSVKKVPASKLKGVAKPMIVAGLELLEQARRDEQATVWSSFERRDCGGAGYSGT